MAFTFGLGSNTMLNQYQRDAAEFKLIDISNNINKYTEAGTASGQAIQSSYVDRTYSEFGRIMQRDQENDNAATFLFEYQALLRSRMQQMITELTAALTRDLDNAMNATREAWNTEAEARQSAQGYSNNLEDAGAARMAYNFFTGYASAVRPAGGGQVDANGVANGVPYVGVDSYDSRASYGGSSQKVPIDTTADALFLHQNNGGALRVTGTAVIQQSFPEDGLPRAVIDDLNVVHQRDTVFYEQVGGGFVTHKNQYRFIDPDATADRTNANNIAYSNQTMGAVNKADELAQRGINLGDDAWDHEEDFADTATVLGTPDYQRFNKAGNAKNEFQRVLYDTIFELDQRNLLRDIFRLSDKNGFFNNIQVASTTSLNTGSQMQASILLNYVPASSQILPANNSTGVTPPIPGASSSQVAVIDAANFEIGDSVYVTVNGNRETAIISNISTPAGAVPPRTLISFNPPLSGVPDALTSVETTRPDLGGKIELVIDRFSAFYHS